MPDTEILAGARNMMLGCACCNDMEVGLILRYKHDTWFHIEHI